MKKVICIAVALALVLGLMMTAAQAEGIVSDTFNLQDEATIIDGAEGQGSPGPTGEGGEAPSEGPGTEPTEVHMEEAVEGTVVDEATPQPQPERSVAISSNIPASEVKPGDEVVLTAILNGYEGAEVEIAWERFVDGTWQPTGDIGGTLHITVDESTMQGLWRFTVTVLSEAQGAAGSAAQ